MAWILALELQTTVSCCVCSESNWGPLEEQPVLSPTELSPPSYATFI